MRGYLSLDITYPLKLTVFLELRSQKQVMSKDKHPSIFLKSKVAILFIILQPLLAKRLILKFGEYHSDIPQSVLAEKYSVK